MAYFSNGKDVSLAEFGTWTPTLQDDSFTDGEGETYAIQEGKFTKIGARVFVEFRIKMASLGTLTGTQAVNIAGLPFPVVGDISGGMMVQGTALLLPFSAAVSGRFDSATNTMRAMIVTAAGHNSVKISELSANGDMKFTGSYRTN